MIETYFTVANAAGWLAISLVATMFWRGEKLARMVLFFGLWQFLTPPRDPLVDLAWMVACLFCMDVAYLLVRRVI